MIDSMMNSFVSENRWEPENDREAIHRTHSFEAPQSVLNTDVEEAFLRYRACPNIQIEARCVKHATGRCIEQSNNVEWCGQYETPQQASHFSAPSTAMIEEAIPTFGTEPRDLRQHHPHMLEDALLSNHPDFLSAAASLDTIVDMGQLGSCDQSVELHTLQAGYSHPDAMSDSIFQEYIHTSGGVLDIDDALAGQFVQSDRTVSDRDYVNSQNPSHVYFDRTIPWTYNQQHLQSASRGSIRSGSATLPYVYGNAAISWMPNTISHAEPSTSMRAGSSILSMNDHLVISQSQRVGPEERRGRKNRSTPSRRKSPVQSSGSPSSFRSDSHSFADLFFDANPIEHTMQFEDYQIGAHLNTAELDIPRASAQDTEMSSMSVFQPANAVEPAILDARTMQLLFSSGSPPTHSSRRTDAYRCNECTEVLADRKGFLRHWRAKHDGRKPFSCRKCFRGFVRKDHLRRHEVKCKKC